MKLIALFAVFVGSQVVFAHTEKEEGWQFRNFFGTYEVATHGGSCSQLSGQVSVGFKNTMEFPSLEIKSVFSSDPSFFVYLRNSKSHGQDCYECDPDWYENIVIAGDGINNAIFTKVGITPYNHKEYSEKIEMVKSNNKIYIKWNSCSAELVKK